MTTHIISIMWESDEHEDERTVRAKIARLDDRLKGILQSVGEVKAASIRVDGRLVHEEAWGPWH